MRFTKMKALKLYFQYQEQQGVIVDSVNFIEAACGGLNKKGKIIINCPKNMDRIPNNNNYVSPIPNSISN